MGLLVKEQTSGKNRSHEGSQLKKDGTVELEKCSAGGYVLLELLDNEETKHRRLGCDLLTSTAYHLQTDGQSEWTNQGV